MKKTIIASDGKDIVLSDIPYGMSEDTAIKYGRPIPVMERDESRADTTITAAGFKLSYDSLGCCYKRVNV